MAPAYKAPAKPAYKAPAKEEESEELKNKLEKEFYRSFDCPTPKLLKEELKEVMDENISWLLMLNLSKININYSKLKK